MFHLFLEEEEECIQYYLLLQDNHLFQTKVQIMMHQQRKQLVQHRKHFQLKPSSALGFHRNETRALPRLESLPRQTPAPRLDSTLAALARGGKARIYGTAGRLLTNL